jgi:hypothetical protein
MRTLILTLSTVVFSVSGYFLITDFKISNETNFNIYLCLLIILMLICIVGILINLPLVLLERKKYRPMIYNSYSNKRTKNNSFDSNFRFLKNI